MEHAQPDMPVNYTYVKEGDRMVVTQSDAEEAGVVLRKENDHDDDDSSLTSRSLANSKKIRSARGTCFRGRFLVLSADCLI